MRAIVFSLTLLVSSFLLFLVQPMIGRMLLPSLGGTPAVWNACVLFFQAILLGGYAWAHYGPPKLGVRNHLLVHLVLLAGVCFLLPMQLVEDWAVPVDGNPLGWLIGQLVLCVGLPFFVISSSAPLLQRWFGLLGDDGDSEPWFLYAISNTGSLVALISYPFLFERYMGLTDQGWFWAFGFMLLAILFVVCGYVTLKLAPDELLARTQLNEDCLSEACLGEDRLDEVAGPLSWSQRVKYIILAAIPSSLMLGVTTVVSTDVGSFPLMWSIPLALYLLTFVFVFAKRTLIPHRWLTYVMPLLLLLMPLIALIDPGRNPIQLIALHFGVFFIVAMVCHGELSRLRPPVSQLTEFYLMMSIGGVVGGAFNTLLAPVAFNEILEYPLMLIAACWVLPRRGTAQPVSDHLQENKLGRSWSLKGIVSQIGVQPFLVAACLGIAWMIVSSMEVPTLARIALGFGIPAVVCYTIIESPKRFAICYTCLALACPGLMSIREVITKERGFFGVNEVALIEDGEFRILINGQTIHGKQRTDQTTNPDPLSYYHNQGPIGDVFEFYGSQQTQVAAVGLGVGSLAAYCQPSQTFDFFEIDPVVCKIAQDERYFNYLSSAQGKINLILGDARIQLDSIRSSMLSSPSSKSPFSPVSFSSAKKEKLVSPSTGSDDSRDSYYDLMIMDAFGSDAVPLHLMTVEAVKLYLELLDEDGLLVFHVSSKFIDFAPLGAGITEHFGLSSAIKVDLPSAEQQKLGRNPCIYMVMSRDGSLVNKFLDSGRGWRKIDNSRKLIWTDEHANVLDLMKW